MGCHAASLLPVQTADRVEDDQLVFDLQPSSPRVRAELREADQHAALNQQLAQQIPVLDSWQQLQQFLQQHGARLNFLNVVALVTHAAALQQVCCCVCTCAYVALAFLSLLTTNTYIAVLTQMHQHMPSGTHRHL